MAGPIFEIYATNVLSGYRNMRRRLGGHLLYTAWSIILMLMVFGALTWLIAFVLNNSQEVSFPMEINDIVFLYFMALLGKSLLDTYHLLVERPASAFYLIQPMGNWKIVVGTLISIISFNLLLLCMGLGLITMFTLIHPAFYFVIPPYLVIDLILLTLIASLYLVCSFVCSMTQNVSFIFTTRTSHYCLSLIHATISSLFIMFSPVSPSCRI